MFCISMLQMEKKNVIFNFVNTSKKETLTLELHHSIGVVLFGATRKTKTDLVVYECMYLNGACGLLY